MSTVGESTPLIHREYVTDKLYQEDPSNADQGRAIYHDHIGKDHRGEDTPGLIVKVDYDTHVLQPYKRKPNFQGKKVTFENRDALLDHEVARRMSEVKDLPDSERYVGYKLTLFQKIKRLFGVNIDGELQDDWKNALKPNYSAKNVYNSKVTIAPSEEVRKELGLESHEVHKLGSEMIWAFNSSLNGYEFIDEDGQKVEIRNGITSSNDRTTRNICMMRLHRDSETQQSIAYTGRPDTKEKAIEQIEFIVRNELKRSHPKGLVKDGDGYTLTYAVNNLMTPMTGIGLVSFDEKEATLQEQEVLSSLAGVEHDAFDEKEATLREQEILRSLEDKTIVVDGHKIRVKPLYFSQPFNQTNSLAAIVTDSHNGKGLARSINETGYETLVPMAQKHLTGMEKGRQKDLLEGAIKALKGDFGELRPQEELFNRALLCHALNLPLVIHCKSSTDRTTPAIAIADWAHRCLKLDKINFEMFKNPKGEVVPHLSLKHEAPQNSVILGNCLSGHQNTRNARTCEGLVKGHEIGTKILGFEWSSNPIVGEILPKRYTKVNDVSPLAKLGVGFLSTLGFLVNLALAIPIWLVGTVVHRDPFFNPIYIKPGISPFADRLIDKKSPYVRKGEGRSLLKPKDMIAL
ncbi:hypothetical protein [Simkania sp.]|uniref:hypothetical protein n=1 Tax=Simkania sp. TaxID=34094 RepID=UPI003B5178CA